MSSLREAALRARERSEALQARAREVVEEATRLVADGEPASSLRVRRLTDEVVGLRKAMETRAVIEQAKGIIMGASGCDPDRAFELLVRQSQHENRKLRDVAAELVARQVTRS